MSKSSRITWNIASFIALAVANHISNASIQGTCWPKTKLFPQIHSSSSRNPSLTSFFLNQVSFLFFQESNSKKSFSLVNSKLLFYSILYCVNEDLSFLFEKKSFEPWAASSSIFSSETFSSPFFLIGPDARKFEDAISPRIFSNKAVKVIVGIHQLKEW